MPLYRWAWPCLVVLAVACGGPTRPPTDSAAKSAKLEDDTATRVLRIEHGLGPEVRVKGERGGASIEERLRVHHTPGVSVAIIHDYRVVSAKAYGVADAATGVHLTNTTMMSAASVSKMVTALVALKEVEAGKIPLEANVNQTLRSWRIPENEFTRATPVTLKHLLSHTAGTNVPSVSQQGEPPPTLLEILDGKPPAVNRPVRVDIKPGTGFRYSGGGTTIVQQLLVDVEGGRPFPEIMNDALFAPLKLTHSTFTTSPSSPSPSMATGHDYDATAVDGGFHIWTGAAAGGLWSTPADLAQLLVEVQLGLRGKSTVVSKEVASRLTTPVLPIAGTLSMAQGAFVEKHYGTTGVYFGHEGLGIGFMTMVRASATTGDGAVVMANSQSAGPLLFEILRSIATEYGWDGWVLPPIDVAATHVDPAHLTALSGRYGAEKSESVFITVKGDHLEAKQPFRKPLELLPMNTDELISREDGIRFKFATNNNVRSLIRTRPPWPPAPPAATLTRLPDDAPLEPLQLLESGRADEALALGKKLLEANAKDPTLDEGQLRDIGEDLLDGLEPQRALPVLQLNLTLHPQSPMANLEVAEALFRSGRRSEAVPHYIKAKSLHHDNATAMSERVEAYFLWRLFRLRALETAAK